MLLSLVCFFAGLHELDSIQDPEVIDFRNHMRKMCERIAREKESQVINGLNVLYFIHIGLYNACDK